MGSVTCLLVGLLILQVGHVSSNIWAIKLAEAIWPGLEVYLWPLIDLTVLYCIHQLFTIAKYPKSLKVILIYAFLQFALSFLYIGLLIAREHQTADKKEPLKGALTLIMIIDIFWAVLLLVYSDELTTKRAEDTEEEAAASSSSSNQLPDVIIMSSVV